MFSQHSVRGDLTPNGLEPKCLLKFALRYRNPTPDGETLTKKPEPCSNIHCVSSKHMRCTSKAFQEVRFAKHVKIYNTIQIVRVIVTLGATLLGAVARTKTLAQDPRTDA